MDNKIGDKGYDFVIDDFAQSILDDAKKIVDNPE